MQAHTITVCMVSTKASLPSLIVTSTIGKEKLVNMAQLLRLAICIIWQQQLASQTSVLRTYPKCTQYMQAHTVRVR